MWPNMVRTPTIPDSGYGGEMIYGGDGHWRDFQGFELEGRVVLMDYNSEARWLQAASLGARAIIFIEPEATTYSQSAEKYSTTPLDIPRFWIDRAQGIELRERLREKPVEVWLKGRMDWERRPAWNIWGRIPGRDPELADETIIVQS